VFPRFRITENTPYKPIYACRGHSIRHRHGRGILKSAAHSTARTRTAAPELSEPARNEANKAAMKIIGQLSGSADNPSVQGEQLWTPNAVKQLHTLAAASLAGSEVITDGRLCGDHRGTDSTRSHLGLLGQASGTTDCVRTDWAAGNGLGDSNVITKQWRR